MYLKKYSFIVVYYILEEYSSVSVDCIRKGIFFMNDFINNNYNKKKYITACVGGQKNKPNPVVFDEKLRRLDKEQRQFHIEMMQKYRGF